MNAIPQTSKSKLSAEIKDSSLDSIAQIMTGILENKTHEELTDIEQQIKISDGRNKDAKDYAAFTNIIGPIVGITNYHITGNLKAVVVIFKTKLRAKIAEKNKAILPSIIKKPTLERLNTMKGYETISLHLNESNSLFNLGFERIGYSELMKAIEKILKKVILSYHLSAYQDKFSEIPVNEKMENILRFIGELKWNNQLYIKPIENLNKFANEDKHSISQNGNMKSIRDYDYDGLLSYILSWIEGQTKRN